MARYIESACKLCRRCGVKLVLKGGRCATPKCAMERQTRGSVRGRRRRVSDRGLQLIEKQKLRYSYGLLEKQFRRVFAQAEKQPGITGENLLALLERRLDNVIYRLGFADSRSQARQLVQHGHILVNGRKARVPSILVKEGDSIGWVISSTKSEYFKMVLAGIEAKSVVSWLTLDRQNLVGRAISLPTPDEIGAEFDSKAIVEYYSR
ncbi:MAG: 30S ribosomal protein S4 [Chloroflexi bacterium]|nr:30S ribosomal protein S4 [Chloroflexota bacterium]